LGRRFPRAHARSCRTSDGQRHWTLSDRPVAYCRDAGLVLPRGGAAQPIRRSAGIGDVASGRGSWCEIRRVDAADGENRYEQPS